MTTAIEIKLDELNNLISRAYQTKGSIYRIERLERERNYLVEALCDNCGSYLKISQTLGLCKKCLEESKKK